MFRYGTINVPGEAGNVGNDYFRRFHPPGFYTIAGGSAFEECCMDVDISRPLGSHSANLTNVPGPKAVRRWLLYCFQNMVEINCFLGSWICGHHRAFANTFYF